MIISCQCGVKYVDFSSVYLKLVTIFNFGFTLLCSVIGLKNFCHITSQSEVKPKPLITCLKCKFSLASCQTHVISLSFWPVDYFASLWLARKITLVLVFRHSIALNSKCDLFWWSIDHKVGTLPDAVLISINFATFVTPLLPLSRGRCVDYQVILMLLTNPY